MTAQPGNGFVRAADKASGIRRIVVSFDADTFAQVRQRAVAQQQSIAEAVRQLVEWGLEA